MEASGLGDGLVAGAALGEHVGGPDDAVAAQAAFDDHLDVVGIGEGVGHQAMVGDGIGLDPVGDLKVDACWRWDRGGWSPGTTLAPTLKPTFSTKVGSAAVLLASSAGVRKYTPVSFTPSVIRKPTLADDEGGAEQEFVACLHVWLRHGFEPGIFTPTY